MTEMSCFPINKVGIPLMKEGFSYRLAFADMGAVICMEQLKKIEEEMNNKAECAGCSLCGIFCVFYNTNQILISVVYFSVVEKCL